jgi:hypothetical protein
MNKVKMSHDCFVCLNKAKDKICSTCECYAHPGCWGEYLKNSTDVFTYIYPGRIIVSTPFYAKCPQCRGDIGNVKPITRSDTHFARRVSLITQFRNMLFSIEMSQNNEEKEAIFSDIFETIITNKDLIKNEEKFNIMLRKKLKFLYEYDGWETTVESKSGIMSN